MKKALLLTISFLSVSYAKASEYIIATITKSEIASDTQALEELTRMKNDGQLGIKETKEDLILTFKPTPEQNELVDKLRKKGLVKDGKTSLSSDTDGACTTRPQ